MEGVLPSVCKIGTSRSKFRIGLGQRAQAEEEEEEATPIVDSAAVMQLRAMSDRTGSAGRRSGPSRFRFLQLRFRGCASRRHSL